MDTAKNSLTTNAMILTLAVISLLGMVGCGSSSSGGSSGTSSSTTTLAQTSSYITSQNGYSVTACTGNSFTTSAGVFSVQLESYSGSSGLNSAWVRVRITGLPSDVSFGSATLSFWTYDLDSSGNILNEVSNPFTIEQYNGVGSFSSISGASQTSYTMSGSPSSLDFVVQMTNPSSNVMNVVIAKSAGGAIQHQIENLVPAIYANPNVYNQAHQNSQLLALHPFANQASNGYSDAQYAQAAQSQFCF